MSEIDQRNLDALAVLACDLKTDDGFAVAQFTRRSRPTWATEFLTTLSSRVLGRISQRLTWTMAWACYVTALITAGDYIAPADWGSFTQFEIPGWPHELVGGFLSILLVFRTDQAYDRFWEGRGRWTALCSECRALERLLLALPPPIADRFLAYLALFPVALKQHLRGEKNSAELAALYRIYQPLDSSGLDAIVRSKNIPMTILFTLSQLAAPMRSSGRGNKLDLVWEELETRLGKLTEVVSECEKIKCTPLPLSYSRHTSRFFSLYTLSLPLALVKETSPLLVPTIVVVTSWVLFATEEIGRIIEDPFSPGSRRGGKGRVRFSAAEMSREDIALEFKGMAEEGGGEGEGEGEGGLVAADAVIARIGADHTLPFNVTARQAESLLGAMGLADRKIDEEEFRLMWTFLGGGSRVRQMEPLPLEKLCDNINREMFFLRLEQRTRYPEVDGFGEEEEEEGGAAAGEEQAAPTVWSPTWTKADAGRWLKAVGYGEYRREFFTNDIDGQVLPELTSKDLAVIGIESVGERKRLLSKIAALVQRR